MRRHISVAEVLRAGVTLKPEEAIAIAQQLIQPASTHTLHSTRSPHATPPYGPPTPENVFLETDGSVSCVGCEVTLAVSEVAAFLQQALCVDSVRLPGSLRYTIARGLLEVDAPPFDSVADFSAALARYERGARVDHVIRVLDRARAALARRADGQSPAVDRRRMTSEIFELRRQLRESDERLYDQQRAIDALVAATATPAKRPRRMALAAGLAVGLTLVGAGELMHSRRGDDPARRPAAVAAAGTEGVIAADTSREDTARAENEPAVLRATTGEVARATEKSGSAPSAAPRFARAGRGSSRPKPGMLDRLHLRWLRGKIAIRHDDL